MIKRLIFAWLLTVSCPVFSQIDSIETKSPVKYFFSLRSGTLVGCRDCTAQNQITLSASTVHGVMLNGRWGLGLGTGFNSFSEWQTLPLFASASLNLGQKSKFFFEFNYGYSKAWIGALHREDYGYKSSKGGVMIQPAVGYKWAYHDMRLYFLVGYHFQRVQSLYEYGYYPPWSSFRAPYDPGSHEVTQQFNRLLIQIGFGWN